MLTKRGFSLVLPIDLPLLIPSPHVVSGPFSPSFLLNELNFLLLGFLSCVSRPALFMLYFFIQTCCIYSLKTHKSTLMPHIAALCILSLS